MRESGFDTSFRFGPFSGSTANYAPVCLNSLLFKLRAVDMAHFATASRPQQRSRRSGPSAPKPRATPRSTSTFGTPAAGLYFDYDYTTNTRSTYHFLSTFYPLWAGMATSPAQASAVRVTPRATSRQPGGHASSATCASGVQWDAPFGWAPTHTGSPVAGLERNGFHDDATRIARKFDATVLENFVRDGTIREKYNVASGSANVASSRWLQEQRRRLRLDQRRLPQAGRHPGWHCVIFRKAERSLRPRVYFLRIVVGGEAAWVGLDRGGLGVGLAVHCKP